MHNLTFIRDDPDFQLWSKHCELYEKRTFKELAEELHAMTLKEAATTIYGLSLLYQNRDIAELLAAL